MRQRTTTIPTNCLPELRRSLLLPLEYSGRSWAWLKCGSLDLSERFAGASLAEMLALSLLLRSPLFRIPCSGDLRRDALGDKHAFAGVS
jgi:hypothetical protein